MGHLFSQNGYQLTNDLKEQILNLLESTNLKELRRLFGLVNFSRDFIPRLSELLRSLTD